jgi:hypothetical protein
MAELLDVVVDIDLSLGAAYNGISGVTPVSVL